MQTVPQDSEVAEDMGGGGRGGEQIRRSVLSLLPVDTCRLLWAGHCVSQSGDLGKVSRGGARWAGASVQ